jgi:hypothetical protein
LDSLTTIYENEIATLDSIVTEKDNQILLGEGLIRSQSEQIKKHQRREKWYLVGLGAEFLLIISILLFK